MREERLPLLFSERVWIELVNFLLKWLIVFTSDAIWVYSFIHSKVFNMNLNFNRERAVFILYFLLLSPQLLEHIFRCPQLRESSELCLGTSFPTVGDMPPGQPQACLVSFSGIPELICLLSKVWKLLFHISVQFPRYWRQEGQSASFSHCDWNTF